MRTILITGGAGFIGSHTAVAMAEAGYDIVIVDNLSNSKLDVIEKIHALINPESSGEPGNAGNPGQPEATGKPDAPDKPLIFYNTDVTDEKAMVGIFTRHNFHGILHFAGLKSVGESLEKPLDYYYNNTVGTMVLAKLAVKYKANNFVFSSSATVYGDNQVPFKEDMDLLPTTNPYGESKAISERILMDVAKANPDFSLSILRYFNPVGAHESGLIGENPIGIPNNLMPYVVKVAAGELEKLSVFGNDYPTIDGSGVRDYIHVMDLAEGHVAAYENLQAGCQIYNLGTGSGVSVLQLIEAFERANQITVPFEITARRPGDIAISYADVGKAKKKLKWLSKRDIDQMCKDAWNYKQQEMINRERAEVL